MRRTPIAAAVVITIGLLVAGCHAPDMPVALTKLNTFPLRERDAVKQCLDQAGVDAVNECLKDGDTYIANEAAVLVAAYVQDAKKWPRSGAIDAKSLGATSDAEDYNPLCFSNAKPPVFSLQNGHHLVICGSATDDVDKLGQ